MKRGEVSTFRFASDYGYGKGGSGAKIPGDADLEFDIELLDWNSKEDLTGKKEIMKETLVPGEGYKKPSDCSKVTISLKVKYQDQVVEENPNLEFTVGEGMYYYNDNINQINNSVPFRICSTWNR